MESKRTAKKRQWDEPQVLYRKGRPTAVLLEIAEYRDILERLEDQHDLRRLAELEKKPRDYRPFEEFLEELASRS